MFAVMSRAKQNFGDFLIFERGRQLVEALAPHDEIVVGRAWLPLGESFTRGDLGRLQAIIVPGGPGMRANLLGTYPFLSDALGRDIPVYFAGVGGRFFPGADALTRLDLGQRTRQLLSRLTEAAPIGVRDVLTEALLRNNGIAASLNGCPAWYYIPKLTGPVEVRTEVRSVAFSVPANPHFAAQAVALVQAVTRLFSDTPKAIQFNQGIDNPELPRPQRAMYVRLADVARRNGWRVIDAAGSLDVAGMLDELDLHVGFRVHSHIYFLSQHKPSFLVAEDSRGLGMLRTLGGRGVAAWPAWLERLAFPLTYPAMRATQLVPGLRAAPAAEIARQITELIEAERETGFAHVQVAADRIRSVYTERMKPFLLRALQLAESTCDREDDSRLRTGH